VSGYVFKPAAGSFAVAYGSSWAVGAPSQITEHFSCGSGSGGMAQITITLK